MLSLILALTIGLFTGVLILVLPGLSVRLRNSLVLLALLGSAFFTWHTAGSIFCDQHLPVLNWGVTAVLAPDRLGMVFALIISTLWLFAAVYSFGYLAGRENQTSFFGFLLISQSVALGVAFAGNLLSLYLFYELLTFATFPLVIHERDEAARKAGISYLIYNLVGAGLILVAIVFTSQMAQSLVLNAIDFKTGQLNIVVLLFVLGFGVKAALMPLHRWLPQAMAAPTPVSALLHAVAVVYSGVYGILRTIYSIVGRDIFAGLSLLVFFRYLAALTVLAGILIALGQDVLKRRLAYQTVSHLSYILLGALSLTAEGLAGSVLQMIVYSLLKVALFFCAGLIAERTGRTRISEFKGIGRALPGTMAIFSLAVLGMIGVLPLPTFWSKYYIMQGNIKAGHWPLAAVLVVSGLLNAFCFIPPIVESFRGEPAVLSGGRKKQALLFWPTAVLTAVALVIGFWPQAVWPIVTSVVEKFF